VVANHFIGGKTFRWQWGHTCWLLERYKCDGWSWCYRWTYLQSLHLVGIFSEALLVFLFQATEVETSLSLTKLVLTICASCQRRSTRCERVLGLCLSQPVSLCVSIHLFLSVFFS
jgi:hypothetical protein